MKIFLSALESVPGGTLYPDGSKLVLPVYMVEKGINFKWNLLSYYYIQQKKSLALAEFIRDNSKEVMIDSGAHSFQKGKKVDWDKYTDEYAEFIKKFDRPNVIGYFEMDVDNVIGYRKVLELRKKLEAVSDKIIPVWHKNRGIDEFKKMCHDYSGKIVAITGFKNEDITDEQYLMFLKYAKAYNCRVHCLGMTRKAILDKVPFDYVDSSSWKQHAVFGNVGKRKITREFSSNRYTRAEPFLLNYKLAMQDQQYYYKKWRKVCKD